MRLALIFGLLLLAACSGDDVEPAVDTYDPARDYYSYANTGEFQNTHLSLDLDVDFEAQQLLGTATLVMRRIDADASVVMLDSRALDIASVEYSADGSNWTELEFTVAAHDALLGSAVAIALPMDGAPDYRFSLRIAYATSPESTALQWLPPELTSGGKQPLLFSQSQAIHARSWIPLQDTPAVRITYDAEIRTPPQLLAVMSANNDPMSVRDGSYSFDMPQPIPPYLLAIAVGNIFFAPLGADTGLYAEPELLSDGVWEFADTQEMLDKAEDLFGPYDWGRYDLLLLPPSFPYGGMENPRLSFITPSLLAGDRSLISVIAHELAHSWSGNLVTNATWRDGWLNEGMTNYLEARLMEVIYGADRVAEEDVINYHDLLENFERIKPEMQALAPRMETVDPDSAQGTIHYNKGKLLLQMLENAYGRPAFDAFLSSYFETYAFKTITSEVFLDFLDSNLLSVGDGNVTREQVAEWLYEPGLPDNAPIPVSETLDAAKTLAVSWSKGDTPAAEINMDGWSAQAIQHFIDNIAADISIEALAELDAALDFSDSSNAEIGRVWFTLAAKRRYQAAYPQMRAYLERYGRAKLIGPIYLALANNGKDRALALEIFDETKHRYHPVVVNGFTTRLNSN
ncbi:MAG: M1 family metallopeptidase [Woeseiaceae bacterium]